MGQQNEVSIKYIGKREPWHDRLYRTGLVFDCNQVRAIPWDMARKLLRHQDLFEKVEPVVDEEPPADTSNAPNEDDEKSDDTKALLDEQDVKNKEQDEEQKELQALYDQVSVMDKDALEDFAQKNYQQNIDKRRGVETLRLEVIGLIDQFGVV